MKIILLLLSVLMVSYAVLGQSCDQLLAPLRVNNGQCITLSIAGVHTQSMAQEGFKGYVRYSNGSLSSVEKFADLQTYETTCSKGGKVQPFSADDAFFVDVSIGSNNNIKISGVEYPLTCGSDFASFQRENFHYYVAIRSVGSSTCPKLYYAEPCSTPTVTPTSSPSIKISYNITIDNQWVTNGVTYYQYGVKVMNEDSITITAIKIASSNWNPTETWNIPSNGDGTYGFPSFVQRLAPNEYYTLGFVSATVNPTFSTVGFTKQ